MSNLARSQADWNKLARELGIFLAVFKLLKDWGRKFNPARSRFQVIDTKRLNDPSYTAVSLWTFSGVKIGTNTDEDGKLWVRITDENPSAGHALVDVYKAAGGSGGDKVASGSAADGATVTLAAANSSGLTGTVKLGTVSASEADDLHALYMFPDWGLRMLTIFDGSEPEHVALQDAFRTAMLSTLQALGSAQTAWSAAITTFATTRLKKFLRSGQSALINLNTTTDAGRVVTGYEGLLEDLRKDMVDELTAGAQTVQQNTITPGSASFDSQNQGLGSMATPTMEQWAQDGLITLVCEDETLGAEEFGVSQYLDGPGLTIAAKNRLRVGREFADPDLGIRSMTLLRSLTLDAGSTSDFAAGSNWAFSGENDRNTDDGLVYLEVVDAGGSTWTLNGYSSSTRSSDTQVFTSVAGAAGATVALTAVNGSGLTGHGKVGSAPTTTNTGTMNLNPFRKKNANSVPDKITVDIVVSAVGEIQQLLGELFDYAINAGGSPTLNDKYVTAGTFPPYEVRDA